MTGLASPCGTARPMFSALGVYSCDQTAISAGAGETRLAQVEELGQFAGGHFGLNCGNVEATLTTPLPGHLD